ncbi:MAG: hypothetical protein J0I21_11585 [Alphaproteobacteria bacterium]|nr:hypothetical protein [Alphaproteobacteria bacterium]
MPRRLFAAAAAALSIAGYLSGVETARADQQPYTPAPTPSNGQLGYESGISGYFQNWFVRSDYARATQPHWMTPLVTVTPRLEQEVRYDQYWQSLGNGADVDSYGSGKGLELIPTTTNEVLINVPAYLVRTEHNPASGWGDWPFLVVKQRLLSANEESGNYIVTAFLGLQAPVGSEAFSNNAWIVTPTIAGGKGWGPFDIQSTLSMAMPASHGDVIGYAMLWNMALQLHFAQYFWPEFETNLTHWFGGVRDGKTQLMLTPGLVLGRFHLVGRVNAAIGAGYQFAVTPKLQTEPALTPLYNHAWIVSARMPF